MGQSIRQLSFPSHITTRRAGSQLLPNPSRDTVVHPGDIVVIFDEPDTLRFGGCGVQSTTSRGLAHHFGNRVRPERRETHTAAR